MSDVLNKNGLPKNYDPNSALKDRRPALKEYITGQNVTAVDIYNLMCNNGLDENDKIYVYQVAASNGIQFTAEQLDDFKDPKHTAYVGDGHKDKVGLSSASQPTETSESALGKKGASQSTETAETVSVTSADMPGDAALKNTKVFGAWLGKKLKDKESAKFKTEADLTFLYDHIDQHPTLDPRLKGNFLKMIDKPLTAIREAKKRNPGKPIQLKGAQPKDVQPKDGQPKDVPSASGQPKDESAELKGTVSTGSPDKFFKAYNQVPDIVGTIRNNKGLDYYSFLPVDDNGNKCFYVKLLDDKGVRQFHPIIFWEYYSRPLIDGIPMTSQQERNDQIRYLLEKGCRVPKDIYDLFTASLVNGGSPDTYPPSKNYPGFMMVSEHILKDERYPKDYRQHVLETLVQVYELTNKNGELLLPKELAEKLAKEFPGVAVEYLAACQPKVEVVKVEGLERKPNESFKDWAARAAKHHQNKAGADANSPHTKVGACYTELVGLYEKLEKEKRPDERKKILTRISLVLGSTDKNGLRSKALDSSLSKEEKDVITAEHGSVQKELIALSQQKPRDTQGNPPVVGPGQGNPPSNGQETPEERERKRKAAIEAAAAARHDPDQQKTTWWQRNQEWIWWLIGILVVSTLGVLAFRKGGWLNKDKKKTTVATGNTNTNTNTNTGNDNNNSNTGGLANNAKVYTAEDICNALATNSRKPPVLSSTPGNSNDGR